MSLSMTLLHCISLEQKIQTFWTSYFTQHDTSFESYSHRLVITLHSLKHVPSQLALFQRTFRSSCRHFHKCVGNMLHVDVCLMFYITPISKLILDWLTRFVLKWINWCLLLTHTFITCSSFCFLLLLYWNIGLINR